VHRLNKTSLYIGLSQNMVLQRLLTPVSAGVKYGNSLKASPIKKNERSARSNMDLKRDSESAIRTVRGSEFQQSMDLLKKEEKNLEYTAGVVYYGEIPTAEISQTFRYSLIQLLRLPLYCS
jgi:hypothetical protein